MLAGGIDYSNPQWCVGKSINGNVITVEFSDTGVDGVEEIDDW